VGVRTYTGLPAGTCDPQDIVQKKAGAVFHENSLALQKGSDGRVYPKGVDIGGQSFEKGSWVGGMGAGVAGSVPTREGGRTGLDVLGQVVIGGRVFRV